MTKQDAILVLENSGWQIGAPEEITVTHDGGDFVVMEQPENGEWIVTEDGSITFFAAENTDEE